MARRWPSWIYGTGEEPDARFSLANERTFLAWVRTALALMAAGVALDVVQADLSATAHHVIVVGFIGVGCVAVVVGWVRCAMSERSLRMQRPLPSIGPTVGLVFAVCVLTTAYLLER